MPKIGKHSYPEGKYYIASEMTGIRYFNYHAFYRVKEDLQAFGFDIASPASIDFSKHGETFRGSLAWGIYAAEALKLLRECQYVILFGKWWRSSGVAVEVGTAHEMRLGIYEYHRGGLFITNPSLRKLDIQKVRKRLE